MHRSPPLRFFDALWYFIAATKYCVNTKYRPIGIFTYILKISNCFIKVILFFFSWVKYNLFWFMLWIFFSPLPITSLTDRLFDTFSMWDSHSLLSSSYHMPYYPSYLLVFDVGLSFIPFSRLHKSSFGVILKVLLWKQFAYAS